MQVQVGTKVNCLHQTCSTWTVKRSFYQPGKVGSAHPPLPDQRHQSTKSYLYQIKQKNNNPLKPLSPGNLRGWFLKPSKTGNSASVVLYLHGITATRAHPPRVFPFSFHNATLGRVKMKWHFSISWSCQSSGWHLSSHHCRKLASPCHRLQVKFCQA